MGSKKKKQKTSHNHHHGKSNQSWKERELSKAEIWDDSALVRSWEDAVREYEYYHSLAARGIDPEAVLDEAEEAEGRGEDVDLELDGSIPAAKVDGPAGDGVENGEVEDGEAEEGEVEEGGVEDDGLERSGGHVLTNGVSAANRVHGKQHGPALPPKHEVTRPQSQHAEATTTQTQASASQVGSADQTLENLKMAYYWAGYYSGLYDGQRQAVATPASSATNLNRGDGG